MPKTIINEELYQYALAITAYEHPVLKQLREYTQTNIQCSIMQIPLEQAIFMAWLAKLTLAKKYLEIGVFTGYSCLAMALAMGPNSQVYALDNDPEIIKIARKYWNLAQVEPQITTYVAHALDSLKLICQEHSNSFDIIFIDANKADYLAYYEYSYQLIKDNGFIIIDNVLFHGEVLKDKPAHKVQAIKEFNTFIRNDKRVEISVLPMSDGITLVKKAAHA